MPYYARDVAAYQDFTATGPVASGAIIGSNANSLGWRTSSANKWQILASRLQINGANAAYTDYIRPVWRENPANLSLDSEVTFRFPWGNRGRVIVCQSIANGYGRGGSIWINLGGQIQCEFPRAGSLGESAPGAGDGVAGSGTTSDVYNSAAIALPGNTPCALTVKIARATDGGGVPIPGTTPFMVMTLVREDTGAVVPTTPGGAGGAWIQPLDNAVAIKNKPGWPEIYADDLQYNGLIIRTYGANEPFALSLAGTSIDKNPTDTTVQVKGNPTGGQLPISYAWWNPTLTAILGNTNPYTFTGLAPGTFYNSQLRVTDSDSPNTVINRQFGYITLETVASIFRLSLNKILFIGDSHTRGNSGPDGDIYGPTGTGTGTGWPANFCKSVGQWLNKNLAAWIDATNGAAIPDILDRAAINRDLAFANGIDTAFIMIGYNQSGAQTPAEAVADLAGYKNVLLGTSPAYPGVENPIKRLFFLVPPPKLDAIEGPRIQNIGIGLENIVKTDTTGKLYFGGWGLWWGWCLNIRYVSSDGVHYTDEGKIYMGQTIASAFINRAGWYNATGTGASFSFPANNPIIWPYNSPASAG